jgi:hypothetical protein
MSVDDMEKAVLRERELWRRERKYIIIFLILKF